MSLAAPEQFKCKECETEVPEWLFNLSAANCFWCALKHAQELDREEKERAAHRQESEG